MSKKIHYVDGYGIKMKRVAICFEVIETALVLETIITVPEDTTDEEIMNLAKTFRNAETQCSFYYPDEE